VSTTSSEKLTLVLGGKGKTGGRVAQRLAAKGVPVRIGQRSGDRPFDWQRPDSWARVLEHVDQAYVTYFPDIAFPGAAERVRTFAELAVDAGVRRLVFLSGRNEEGALRGEAVVRNSGAEYTIVRSSFFAQNFSEGFFVDAVVAGEVAFPADRVREPFTDVDDIADIAAEALTTDEHVGQLYEVTGPRLMTFAEAVAEIATATGRSITYVPISNEEFASALAAEETAAALADAGLSPDDVKSFTDLITGVLDGRSEYLADGVQRALGRAPRDFAEFARAAAATGVWDADTERIAS
jgi:uncharacterized protein YbjT (DUF2867 family)